MNNKQLWTEAEELVGERELSRRFRNWIMNLIRTARMKRGNVDSRELYEQDAKRVIADLNERSGARFGVTETALCAIVALLKKGYTVEDFMRVHEAKALKWMGDEKMRDYLRPSTLYRMSHFDEYLAEYYAIENAKHELDKKRARARGVVVSAAENKDRAIRANHVIGLLERPWYSFESWAEFMKHVVKFPDAAALGGYDMPERIRQMRSVPGMVMKVLRGESPAWAEAEYRELKEQRDDQGR